MIGRLIIPMIERIAAYLSALDLSLYALVIIISPIYITNKTSSEVSLASHTHQVPQVGFPQIDPDNKVANVKQAPIGAHDLEIKLVRVCLKTIEQKPQIAMIEYIIRENQAHGTWMYIILTVSP